VAAIELALVFCKYVNQLSESSRSAKIDLIGKGKVKRILNSVGSTGPLD